MKKILYYLRLLLFIPYLVIIFLLIDNLYKTSFLSIIFFLLNLIYSFIMILTILSKKKIYQETISFNFLNIGIYTYIFMLYRITSTNSILDIINNKAYFNNNYIMLSILLIGLTTYAIFLNNEKSGN
ncbi:MAG: hypothetical protein ACI4WF_01850 [Bacilli bacterium]